MKIVCYWCKRELSEEEFPISDDCCSECGDKIVNIFNQTFRGVKDCDKCKYTDIKSCRYPCSECHWLLLDKWEKPEDLPDCADYCDPKCYKCFDEIIKAICPNCQTDMEISGDKKIATCPKCKEEIL